MSEINNLKLPNFFLIGAAKAGTTSLYDLLKQHPQIYLPFNKEPMFFSQDSIYNCGLDWYSQAFFKRAAKYPARGEASPHYLYWSEKVAPRIKKNYGQVPLKFLVIFRDPVLRAYSWYRNMIKEGREDLPFELALEQETTRLEINQGKLRRTGAMTYGYKFGSCYASNMEPFLNNFPFQNFFFLLQEELNNNFKATIERLFEFLEINPKVSINPVSSNRATLSRSNWFQYWLNIQSSNREILKTIIPLRIRYNIKKSLLKANAQPTKYPSLDPALETKLRLQFAPEVKNLEKIIDKDLSAWLPQDIPQF